MPTQSLTTEEKEQLAKHERTISNGLKTFVDVGTALSAIKDSKLYRKEFDTFEEYCQSKWGWGKAYAYQLIGAAEVKKSPIGDSVKNQAQARELAKVEPEKRAEVIEKAIATADAESRPMTARDIADAARGEDEDRPRVTQYQETEVIHKGLKKLDFGKRLENYSLKGVELLQQCEDATDVESLEEELKGLLEKIHEKYLEFKHSKAA